MSLAGREIIIVDDDIAMSQAIERLLRVVGGNARYFASAEDFLDSGTGRGADVLILDIHLPGISGIELHHQLSASGSITPVVYITGHDTAKNREIARERGVVYFIKPFDGSELITAIERHLPPLGFSPTPSEPNT